MNTSLTAADLAQQRQQQVLLAALPASLESLLSQVCVVCVGGGMTPCGAGAGADL